MNTFLTYIATIINLSGESREALLACATEMHFKRNELLLREGQVCRAIFFISSGMCKAYYNRDGKEINTAFYFENSFAANVGSLLAASPSEYAIKACEPTAVVRLDKTRLLEAYEKSHEIERFSRKVLETIVAEQEEHAANFKLKSPAERFDHLLATNPDFLQRVSLTQTASYLGMSRETLSRLRARKSPL